MVYYNVMVNISMCYNNQTIVNMYWYYRKLIYKIIVNGGSYRITYFVACYWIHTLSLSLYIYNYYSVAGYKTYFVASLSYDNYYINLQNYSNSLLSGLL